MSKKKHAEHHQEVEKEPEAEAIVIPQAPSDGKAHKLESDGPYEEHKTGGHGLQGEPQGSEAQAEIEAGEPKDADHSVEKHENVCVGPGQLAENAGNNHESTAEYKHEQIKKEHGHK